MLRQQRQQPAQRHKPHANSRQPAHQRQQQILNPELLLYLPSRSPQRHARRHFRRPPHHPHQRQPRQIRARNQQDQPRRRHQRHRLRTQLLCLPLLQRHRVVAHLRVRIVMQLIAALPLQPRAIDLRIRLLPRRPIAQPRDGVKIRAATLTCRSRLQVRINIRVQRSRRALRQHANHRIGLTLQQNRSPNNVAVRPKQAMPQPVTQNRSFRSVRPVFILCEVPPHHRRNRQHIEIMRRNPPIRHVSDRRTGLQVHP